MPGLKPRLILEARAAAGTTAAEEADSLREWKTRRARAATTTTATADSCGMEN